jgi:hypothetical protein
MLGRMRLTQRLTALDDRVLRDRSTPTTRAWGARNGWWVFLLLGGAILATCAWAVAEHRPVIAFMNVGFGAAYVGVAAYLWNRRRKARDAG